MSVITRSIVGPIKQGVEFAASISKGDMTQTLEIEQKDEIGHLAGALNEMRVNMRLMIADIDEWSANSGLLLNRTISDFGPDGLRDRGHFRRVPRVATAAEESSANTASVAASMEETTASLSFRGERHGTNERNHRRDRLKLGKARAISSEATVQARQSPQ